MRKMEYSKSVSHLSIPGLRPGQAMSPAGPTLAGEPVELGADMV
ncbi:hypothetical protein [Agrobacterium tumefaciens]|nr:hypothetical protein [Agrobacterium tumefaciens]